MPTLRWSRLRATPVVRRYSTSSFSARTSANAILGRSLFDDIFYRRLDPQVERRGFCWRACPISGLTLSMNEVTLLALQNIGPPWCLHHDKGTNASNGGYPWPRLSRFYHTPVAGCSVRASVYSRASRRFVGFPLSDFASAPSGAATPDPIFVAMRGAHPRLSRVHRRARCAGGRRDSVARAARATPRRQKTAGGGLRRRTPLRNLGVLTHSPVWSRPSRRR